MGTDQLKVGHHTILNYKTFIIILFNYTIYGSTWITGKLKIFLTFFLN